jgi:serine/threonine protein kinase
MEICGGIAIRWLYNKKTATEDEAKLIVRQVATGVKALHQASIYHKDLKGSNWMLNRTTLGVKLIDFGMAVDNNDRTTDVFLADGYHVPECFTVKELTPSRVDPWYIGVTLYMMMFIRKPFGMDQFMSDKPEYERRVANLEYDLPDNISPELADFFRQTLTYEDKRLTIDGILAHPFLASNQHLASTEVEQSYDSDTGFHGY